MGRWYMGFLGVPLLTAGCNGGPEPAIQLAEVWTAELPSDFQPVHAELRADGSALFLSAAPAMMIRADPFGGVEAVAISEDVYPVGIRAVGRSGHFEIMSETGTVSRYSPVGGEATGRQELDLLGTAIQGAPAPDGWFLATASRGELAIHWLKGRELRRLGQSEYGRNLIDPAPVVHLTSTGSVAVLSTQTFPPVVFAVDTSGTIHFDRRLDGIALQQTVSTLNHGISLPAIWLGDHIAQTVADRHTDTHHLILYPVGEATVRFRPLPGPLTFSGATGDRVLALRNLTGRSEAVMYKVEGGR